MILGSLLGQIFSPIFKAMSWLLAFYYGLAPNYIVAITLLTFTVMIISFPLNRAATRSMFKMQLLAPEMQKIRNKYKATRDMSALERQETRQKMNEETMALYRENNVSMLGGCLPNLAVFPIFIVLYDVIRGLTTTCLAPPGSGPGQHCVSGAALKTTQHLVTIWAPWYVSNYNSALARNLTATKGQMNSFGINLDSTVRTAQAHWYLVLPFVAFVLVAIALQYLQLRQMTRRNTSTANAPGAQQMQTMQRVMPLVMAVIYISIPAAVVVYFVASSLFRIGQQEWMYRRDPQITAAVRELHNRKTSPADKKGSRDTGPATPERPPPRSFRERLALAIAPAEDTEPADDAAGQAKGNGRVSTGKSGSGTSSSARTGGAQKQAARPPGNRQGRQTGSRQGTSGTSEGSQKSPGGGQKSQSGPGSPAAKGGAPSGRKNDRKESRNGSGNPSGTSKPSSGSSGPATPPAQERRRQRKGD